MVDKNNIDEWSGVIILALKEKIITKNKKNALLTAKRFIGIKYKRNNNLSTKIIKKIRFIFGLYTLIM